MKLHALNAVLRDHPAHLVRFRLPSGDEIPPSFHVTEVGQVSKVFVDCGGKVHSELKCVLQTWLGRDTAHRLKAARLERILELGRSVVATEELDVEVEYEDTATSQYAVGNWLVRGDELVFDLAARHTDCLAKAYCEPAKGEEACCAPAGCC